MLAATFMPATRSGGWSAAPGVKSEYGRLIRRSQSRTMVGTGKYSPNGTRWLLS